MIDRTSHQGAIETQFDELAKPRSLLLISHSYPPVLGGSEMEAQRVCAALIERGHAVTVLCAGGGPMPRAKKWVDPAGVPVRIIGGRAPERLRNYVFALGVIWILLRERRNYEIVYFLMQGLHLAAGLPVARLLGKSIVMKVSGSSIITTMRRSWTGRLELRLLRKWAGRVMILNPGIEREALEAGLHSSQLAWMPNPVDEREFSPCSPEDRAGLRSALGIRPEAPVVVFVGRLAPEKELHSLIMAFADVRRKAPDSVLVLIGDGPMRKQLQALAAELHVPVRFTGRLDVRNVVDWLRAGDVFALVSSNEGFPCSLVEAMCTGLPAVVSDIPANTQLIKPLVTGLHARLGDHRSIADALTRLLLNGPLRRELGAAARRDVVAEYSTRKVITRYERLFAEVCSRDGIRPKSAPDGAQSSSLAFRVGRKGKDFAPGSATEGSPEG